MRVIAGTARSLKLKAPEGLHTRPTTDRIKETLFNMLQPYIADSIFVDLFSGSGGIGIEALSRGAKKAYFIDNNTEAVSCIRDNLKTTHLAEQAVVLKQDIMAALSNITEKEVDIIFMDPPYEAGYESTLFQVLQNMPYITEDTMLIIEALPDTDFSHIAAFGFSVYKEKQYKTNKHVFIQKENSL